MEIVHSRATSLPAAADKGGCGIVGALRHEDAQHNVYYRIVTAVELEKAGGLDRLLDGGVAGETPEEILEALETRHPSGRAQTSMVHLCDMQERVKNTRTYGRRAVAHNVFKGILVLKHPRMISGDAAQLAALSVSEGALLMDHAALAGIFQGVSRRGEDYRTLLHARGFTMVRAACGGLLKTALWKIRHHPGNIARSECRAQRREIQRRLAEDFDGRVMDLLVDAMQPEQWAANHPCGDAGLRGPERRWTSQLRRYTYRIGMRQLGALLEANRKLCPGAFWRAACMRAAVEAAAPFVAGVEAAAGAARLKITSAAAATHEEFRRSLNAAIDRRDRMRRRDDWGTDGGPAFEPAEDAEDAEDMAEPRDEWRLWAYCDADDCRSDSPLPLKLPALERVTERALTRTEIRAKESVCRFIRKTARTLSVRVPPLPKLPPLVPPARPTRKNSQKGETHGHS